MDAGLVKKTAWKPEAWKLRAGRRILHGSLRKKREKRLIPEGVSLWGGFIICIQPFTK